MISIVSSQKKHLRKHMQLSVYETKTCNVWHIRNTWANICCLQANPAKNKTQTQLSSLLQTSAELL